MSLCGSVAKNNSDIQFAYKVEVITSNFVFTRETGGNNVLFVWVCVGLWLKEI